MQAEDITRRRVAKRQISQFDPATMVGGACHASCVCAGCGLKIPTGHLLVEAWTSEDDILYFHPACGMVAADEMLARLKRV